MSEKSPPRTILQKQGVKVSADPDDYDFEDEEYLTEDESGDIKDN